MYHSGYFNTDTINIFLFPWLLSQEKSIDNLHISHNASGMGANIYGYF